MKTEHTLNPIRQLLGQDKLEEALKLLKAKVQSGDLFNDLIHQEAKLNKTKDQMRKGVISLEQVNISRAQVRSTLLDITDQLEEVKLPKTSSKKSYPKKLLLALVLILLACLTYKFVNSGEKLQKTNTGVLSAKEVGALDQERTAPSKRLKRSSNTGVKSVESPTTTASNEEKGKTSPKALKRIRIIDEQTGLRDNKFEYYFNRMITEMGIEKVVIDGSKNLQVSPNKNAKNSRKVAVEFNISVNDKPLNLPILYDRGASETEAIKNVFSTNKELIMNKINSQNK